jgi:hypothetical protein
MSEIQFHPLADIFPLLEGAEFDAFTEDIKAHGQHARIVLKDGMILEGRNRYRACLAAGIEPSFACKAYSDQITDPAAYVISANLHRRHLTAEQKREVIAKVIAAKPEASDRQIAKVVKADHKTVARARAEAEDVGKVPHVETRTDTKGRKQPAKKGWSRERHKAHRARERGKPIAVKPNYDDQPKVAAEEISRVAYRLIQLDIGLAHDLCTILEAGQADRLAFDLDTGIEIESRQEDAPQIENAPPPDIGAENMRAQIAALDDGLDIPKSLRRTP